MITITTNSKQPVGRDTLASINNSHPTTVINSNNILSLNKPRTAQTPASAAEAGIQQSVPSQATVTQQNVPTQTTNVLQSPSANITAMTIPALNKPVQKGQKVNIDASGQLSGVKALFGWNVSNSQCDVDVSAFLLSDSGKVVGDSWFVFYGQTESPDGSTRFVDHATNDRQMIEINLARVNSSVQKIVFVLTINDALVHNLNFGMLKDAYVRIMDAAGTNELVSFKLTEYYSNITSMMIGELYRYNGTWKFNAVGNGVARDLAGLCEYYGVQVV